MKWHTSQVDRQSSGVLFVASYRVLIANRRRTAGTTTGKTANAELNSAVRVL